FKAALLGKLDLGSVITAQLVKKQNPVAIKNTLKDKRLTSDFLSKFYLKSVLLTPVVVQGRTIGLVIMESNKIRDFNHDDLALAMLASSQIGISLENARLYERMEKLARFDELTNIYNRRAFHELVEVELGQSRKKSGRLSLIMVDIDLFKQINDCWGHQVGDHVLARVAELLKQKLRAEDSVARFGGEEFVIILPGADCRTAFQVAERIRRTVEDAKWPDGMKVTVSAGVASYPDDGEKLAELLKSADQALYSAKSGGRNQVRLACGLGPE
ncbi:MAG: sensor domain-containing diguanylate cyclase, partial [Firmicutes bacterium]|nr:sensor domain-containing diguanylate cyclase [Bacillota bacterium]